MKKESNKTGKDYLQAITVCVNYSNYLELIIQNKSQFDNWIIVTTKEDSDTIKLCKKHDLSIVFTDRLYQNGDAFNKGKAINDGLKHVKAGSWIALLDADTILPDRFKEIFFSNNLNKKYIYTCKYRAHCPDYNYFQSLQNEFINYKISFWQRLKQILSIITRHRIKFNKEIFNNYPILSDIIVEQEQRKRSDYAIKTGIINNRWLDSSLLDDDSNIIKQNWLNDKNTNIVFEQNDFKAGFLQVFNESTGQTYCEDYGTAGITDTMFFNQFFETVDESKNYTGLNCNFIEKKWNYITIPHGFPGSHNFFMICYHLGDSFINWEGIKK